MPIYEYECGNCGSIEEALQKFSDAPLTTCKRCSGKLHKLVSQSSFHLKGSGWYVTDYTDKNAKKTEDPSSAPAKKNGDSKAAGDGAKESSGKSSTTD